MNKNTPGPWEISGGALRIFSEKTNEPIAFVLQCSPEDGLSPTPEKAIANARLIAAAPDLLVALTNLIPTFGHIIKREAPALYENARASIAKATGDRI